MKVILSMPLLSLNNANIKFRKRLLGLVWKFYSIAKIIFTISWVQLINKYKFANINLEENSETFVLYVIVLETSRIIIHLF